MRHWPSCSLEQLKKHLDEYEFRLDMYATCPPGEDVYTGDPKVDEDLNLKAHLYRIDILQKLINMVQEEIEEYV